MTHAAHRLNSGILKKCPKYDSVFALGRNVTDRRRPAKCAGYVECRAAAEEKRERSQKEVEVAISGSLTDSGHPFWYVNPRGERDSRCR